MDSAKFDLYGLNSGISTSLKEMIAAGLTDKGKRRKDNQDNYYINVIHSDEQAMCVVCDGMGGAKSGNVASTLAVDVFVQEVKRSWTSS